jgi:Phytanoyl-CoA dioxygenase (PhyH)
MIRQHMDCRPEWADPDVIIGQATMRVGWGSKKLPKNGLTHHEVEQFIDDGFVHLQQVVPPAIVTAGRKVMWADLAQNPDDPSSWTQPVVRLLPSDTRPFEKAFDNSRLHAALDQFVGVGRWQPRTDLGFFIVRFPHPDDPGDTGWHIDSSFAPEGEPTEDYFNRWRVNVSSRERALLMLFLYSDVGPDDAPTRIRVGSHLDLPPVLLPAGPGGMTGADASALATQASASRPTALATGSAGDVYLCHPFLVHAAQPIRGTVPRFMAQPPLASREPFVLNRSDGDYSPIETSIRRGLGEPR